MPWHNQNTYGYVRTSQEAIDNATMVYNTLRGLGWLTNPICAMLGNVEAESSYNPWRWQDEVVLPMNDPRIGMICGGSTAHAYGLCQQDPAAKYIYRTYAQNLPDYRPNFSDRPGGANDGTAQLQYLHWICLNGDPDCGGTGEWDAHYDAYSMPFTDFISDTTHTIDYLTHTFFGCYERGTWTSTRVTAAQYWYNYFGGYVPPQPVPIPPDRIAAYYQAAIARKKKKQAAYYKRWFQK